MIIKIINLNKDNILAFKTNSQNMKETINRIKFKEMSVTITY